MRSRNFYTCIISNVIHEVEKRQSLEAEPLKPSIQEDEVKTISIVAKSQRFKAGPKIQDINDSKINHSPQESRVKVIPIKRKRPPRGKGSGGNARKPKMAKQGHEMEDVEFANFVNEKVFNILSQRGENISAEVFLDPSFSSEKVSENYDSSRWLPAHMDEGPCQVPPPSKKRLKKYLASEKMHMERYYKVRDKCAESEESLREQKEAKPSRGSLGWMVLMETKNFHCPRKAIGWRWEEEVTDDEDQRSETDSKSEPVPSPKDERIEQRAEVNLDREKEDKSEDEDDPDEMDVNEDDRASKLLDSLLLDGDSVSESQAVSEDITASTSQSISGASVSMPVFEF